jgi:hypothetical protein
VITRITRAKGVTLIERTERRQIGGGGGGRSANTTRTARAKRDMPKGEQKKKKIE